MTPTNSNPPLCEENATASRVSKPARFYGYAVSRAVRGRARVAHDTGDAGDVVTW